MPTAANMARLNIGEHGCLWLVAQTACARWKSWFFLANDPYIYALVRIVVLRFSLKLLGWLAMVCCSSSD
jgi:hypothetical protein